MKNLVIFLCALMACLSAAPSSAAVASRFNNTTIIADSCAIGMADSTAILNVKGLKILGFGIRISGPASATVTGGLSLRWNANNGTAAADSFTIRVLPDSATTVSIGPSLARAGYEIPVVVQADMGLAAKFGSATGAFVAADRFSCPSGECTFDYVTVRWRTLACTTGNAPLVKIWMLVIPR